MRKLRDFLTVHAMMESEEARYGLALLAELEPAPPLRDDEPFTDDQWMLFNALVRRLAASESARNASILQRGLREAYIARAPAVRPATPDAEGPSVDWREKYQILYENADAAFKELAALAGCNAMNAPMTSRGVIEAVRAELTRLRASDAVLRAALRNIVHNANDLAHAAAIHGDQDETAIMLGDIARLALAPAASSSPNPEGNRRE